MRLAIVLAVALTARLTAAAWWHSRIPEGERFAFGDSESYWQLGESIARGDPYTYGPDDARVFRTPGYPGLLAGLIRVAGTSVPCARVASAVLGTLAVGGIYGLGCLLFDSRTGLWAAVCAAIYPGSVAMGGLVLSESPFSALLVLQLILWSAALREPRPRRATALLLAAGATAGFATLVRPSWFLFTPCAALVGATCCRDRRRHLTSGCLLLAGLVVVMLPWWIRNGRVAHTFVPTTLQVGASLYDGLNPHATGASNMDIVAVRQANLRRALSSVKPAGRQSLEASVDRTLRDDALRWARHHPRRALELARIKLVRMWNVWPNEPSYRQWPVRLAVFLSFTPLVAFSLAGFWKFRNRGWPLWLCGLPAVYFSLLHVVFVGSIRYRQPAMLLLMVPAAAWVAFHDS